MIGFCKTLRYLIVKTQEIIYTFSYNIDIIPGISIIKKVEGKRYGKGEGDLHGDQGSGRSDRHKQTEYSFL